jgi:hypothetical protein
VVLAHILRALRFVSIGWKLIQVLTHLWLGYAVGKDLFNVPFDWRYPLDGLIEFYASLQATVSLPSTDKRLTRD